MNVVDVAVWEIGARKDFPQRDTVRPDVTAQGDLEKCSLANAQLFAESKLLARSSDMALGEDAGTRTSRSAPGILERARNRRFSALVSISAWNRWVLCGPSHAISRGQISMNDVAAVKVKHSRSNLFSKAKLLRMT